MNKQRVCQHIKPLLLIELIFVVLGGLFVTSFHPYWIQALVVLGILILLVTLLVWSCFCMPTD